MDIPCTFDRPSRRRGPPNRHAEAIKKRRFDSPGTSIPSAPSSPTHAAQTLASFAQQQVLSAEAILPFPILQLLLDDYFTYIHPLTPVPHEPSFRAALERREDLSNPTFLALLASMVGCLVASFPRRAQLHLQAQNMENISSNSIGLIDRCHKVAIEAMGPAYLDKNFTVHDAVISYLQGLIGAYTFNWQACRVYFGQCLNISRTIGLHKAKGSVHTNVVRIKSDMNPIGNHEGLPEQGIDLILQELGRRTFWIIFIAIKSLHQLGVSCAEVCMPPATPAEPYPPLPLEVDDEYIFSTHVLPQPEDRLSGIAGFNAKLKILSTYNSLSTAELVYGVDQVFDWDRQKRIVEQSLQALKEALENTPSTMRLDPKSRFRGLHEQQSSSHKQAYAEKRVVREYGNRYGEEQFSDRTRIQSELQKLDIYATQVGTRSYLVEKYWNLFDAQTRSGSGDHTIVNSPGILAVGLDHMIPGNRNSQLDLLQQHVANEREDIMRDLLNLMGMIRPFDIELVGTIFVSISLSCLCEPHSCPLLAIILSPLLPRYSPKTNPHPFLPTQINKLRQISTPLLAAPPSRKGPFAQRAEDALSAYLAVFTKLERFGAEGASENGSRGMMQEDEDEEESVLRGIWDEIRGVEERWGAGAGDGGGGVG